MKYLKAFNYAGTKYRILDQIFQYFPKDIKILVEPFVGSGSVFLNTDAEYYIINDSRLEIYAFWYSIFHNIETLKNTVDKFNCKFKENKQKYFQLRDLHNKNLKTKNLNDIAATFYILTNTCINGHCRWNNKDEFNQAWGNRNCTNNILELKPIFEKLQGKIKIFNKDYTFLFRKILDRYKNKLNDFFFYCDPPYFIQPGAHKWSDTNEKNLYFHLNKINNIGSKFCLSNIISTNNVKEENNIIKTELKQYNVIDIAINYNSGTKNKIRNSGNKTREILVKNF